MGSNFSLNPGHGAAVFLDIWRDDHEPNIDRDFFLTLGFENSICEQIDRAVNTLVSVVFLKRFCKFITIHGQFNLGFHVPLDAEGGLKSRKSGPEHGVLNFRRIDGSLNALHPFLVSSNAVRCAYDARPYTMNFTGVEWPEES